MIRLENWHYAVEFGCDADAWRLTGEVFGHPNHCDGEKIFVSTPKNLDRQSRLLITTSGREYYLGHCGAPEEENLAHIEGDITRGNTQLI